MSLYYFVIDSIAFYGGFVMFYNDCSYSTFLIFTLSIIRSYNEFTIEGVALKFLQLVMCYFSTLNIFHIPLLIISMIPVTKLKICGLPKALLAMLGDKVATQTILNKKFTKIIT